MKTTNETTESNSQAQARAQLESITAMVAKLNSRNEDTREEGQTEIQEDALSVEVRSGWHQPGAKMTASEFCILLCTGGPAVRIIGELNHHNEPENAKLEHQDWGTPWTEYRTSSDEDDVLLDYCRQFYFGD